MHERHDLDLIAAFADGDLDGDTTPVEELIASCPECRSEFDSQREMRAILQAAPAVAMSDEERAAVRSGVHARLDQPVTHSPTAPVIDLQSRRRSTRRWLAIGSVAAATLAVVGVTGVLNLGGDDSGTFEAAVESADDAGGEMTQGDGMELRLPDSATEGTFGADAAQDESATAAGVEEDATTETTAAAADTTMAAEAPFLPFIEPGPGPISQSELDRFVTETLRALETGSSAEELTAEWFNLAEKPTPTCIASVDDPIYAVIRATVETDTIEVLIVRDELTLAYRDERFVVPACSTP